MSPDITEVVAKLNEAWRLADEADEALKALKVEDHDYVWSPDGPECGICENLHTLPDPSVVDLAQDHLLDARVDLIYALVTLAPHRA